LVRLAPSSAQVEAREAVSTLGWVEFGCLVPVYLMLAGYYVMRFQVRKKVRGRGHPESLFIAGLAVSWVFTGALVVRLPSRPFTLAVGGVGAVFGFVFLLTVVDNLRRHGLGIIRPSGGRNE
jgi:hypothetical protein